MHCHLKLLVPPVVFGFNHEPVMHKSTQFSKIGQFMTALMII